MSDTGEVLGDKEHNFMFQFWPKYGHHWCT